MHCWCVLHTMCRFRVREKDNFKENDPEMSKESRVQWETQNQIELAKTKLHIQKHLCQHMHQLFVALFAIFHTHQALS